MRCDADVVPSVRACCSYDSGTAKHKIVYDGVDTDEYVEDLESGSQEVCMNMCHGCASVLQNMMIM